MPPQAKTRLVGKFKMPHFIFLGLIGVISLLPMPALASYYVYCANGRV
jgi:hypothetical protein